MNIAKGLEPLVKNAQKFLLLNQGKSMGSLKYTKKTSYLRVPIFFLIRKNMLVGCNRRVLIIDGF